MEKVIEIKNFSYTYPDGTEALREIDLEILSGESVGIIGPNGAGKSTLLLTLNGILNGRGGIRILGLEMNNKNLNAIRSKVGIVFQDPDDQLFMPTVFDDVAFGPLNLGTEESVLKVLVETALGQVGMQGYENRSPHHLSFGERKKVALACILSMHPEILALDEPSSNLDPHSRRSIIKILQQIKGTKIIATHDLEMVLDICQRVIVLNHGRIVTAGKTKEILTDTELMESNGLEVPASLRSL